MIHPVICKIVATNVMAGHPAHQALHHALGRIPQQKCDGPAGSISADGGDLTRYRDQRSRGRRPANHVQVNEARAVTKKRPSSRASNTERGSHLRLVPPLTSRMTSYKA